MKKWKKQLALDSGWLVRLRTVPPLAASAVQGKFQYPAPPKMEVKTLAGSEVVEAPIDSPAYQAYFDQCREVDRARDSASVNFAFGYGVVEWSEDGESWTNKAPDDWQLDDMLIDALDLTEDERRDKRLLWIKYGLIATNDDLLAMQRVIYGVKEANPADVQSAEDSFQD